MTDEEKAYATSQMRAALKELQGEHRKEIEARDRDMHAMHEDKQSLKQQLGTCREELRQLQDKYEALATRFAELPQPIHAVDERHREVLERLTGLAQLINGVAVIAARAAH